MTDAGSRSEPSGPPARLLTRAERVRRRRAVALAVVLIGTFAVFLTVLLLRAATRPDAEISLGTDTFRVGSARLLERRIRADQYPLLFQDLRDGSIDVWVDHRRGAPFYEGWRAIEAHAPGAPRRCQLEWTGSGYRDPCDGRTFPSNGAGLRRFEASVVKGEIIINFRRAV